MLGNRRNNVYYYFGFLLSPSILRISIILAGSD
jgi:hypothetical protein